MVGEFSTRFDNAAAEERYNQVVIHMNIWEEQGFKFDDGLDYYGLDMIIYKCLHDLNWLRFGRQPARANIKWAREFYAHNASGENTVINFRGKLIPADAAAINEILDLSNNQPSIYELMTALEEIDYNSIKDALCLPNTKWKITGKSPGTVSRRNLLPEAKLWNTIVKRNLMPTSHNQTVDRKRLVLIHSLIFGTKFNVGEVIVRELSEACKNDKGILVFFCLISALYHRHGVAIPTPAQSEHTEAPAPVAATQEESARSEPTTPPAAPQGSLSATSAAQGSYFPPAQHTPPTAPAPANFAATPSAGAGETEEVHYSSNAESDAFDWHTPYETQPPSPPAPAPPANIVESSGAQKCKAPAARVIREDTPLDQPADPPAADDPPAQPSPAKRRRRLHIILSDSKGDDDNNEDGSDDPASSRYLAF
ncbi:hypothetical protein V6N11_082624 [Hibiscus sabdariffa]|uniref:Putative plant transposon protein domain-containing protein n=1 Tax=Hibiscus sabdariffa TaxID=183260 RepID=A0ABR2P992_9ROSI